MLNLTLIVFTLALSLVVAIVLYFYTTRTTLQGRRVKTSDKTAGSPVLAQIPGWDRKPADPGKGDLGEFHKHGSLHQYLLHLHQNGHQPIAMFWWGQQRVVSICSPKMFKDTAKLINKPKQVFPLFEPVMGPLSIAFANGHEWEERKKWIYESLRGITLENYIPIFIKIAAETVTRLLHLGDESVVDMLEEFLTMTLKGITRTCYGSVFSDEEQIRKMSHVYQKVWGEMEQNLLIGPPEPGSTREKMRDECIQQMRDAIQRVITKRRNGEEEETIPFIDALLQSGAPDEQITSDAITFLIGGLHTAGYWTYWTIHYLTLNEGVYQKLVQEMKEKVGPDRGDKLKSYVYDQTTLLRQVLNEVLRLTTLATYGARYSDDDIAAGGHLIPAGTPIIMALGVSLKNETVWKDVEKFDHTQCSHLQSKDLLAFTPFGYGRRKCPGHHFAYIEVSVYLTILLQMFTFKPVGKAKDVGKFHGLVTTPIEPLNFIVYSNKQ